MKRSGISAIHFDLKKVAESQRGTKVISQGFLKRLSQQPLFTIHDSRLTIHDSRFPIHDNFITVNFTPGPPVWYHDIFQTNGTPYKSEETKLIRELIITLK